MREGREKGDGFCGGSGGCGFPNSAKREGGGSRGVWGVLTSRGGFQSVGGPLREYEIKVPGSPD